MLYQWGFLWLIPATVIAMICTHHHMQELKKLLIEVTDHDTLDLNGDAPLHYFVKRKDKEKFKCLMTFLIYSKCDINMLNVDGQTALHLACQV